MKTYDSLEAARAAGYEIYDRNAHGYVVARWGAERRDGTRVFELARASYPPPSPAVTRAVESLRGMLPPGHPLKGGNGNDRYPTF